MTKKMKHLNNYIDATIGGMERTFDTAKENGWSFVQFSNVIQNDHDLCLGACLFAEIYEHSITENERNLLMKKLSDAEHTLRLQFTR